jgi:hypothetical protein
MKLLEGGVGRGEPLHEEPNSIERRQDERSRLRAAKVQSESGRRDESWRRDVMPGKGFVSLRDQGWGTWSLLTAGGSCACRMETKLACPGEDDEGRGSQRQRWVGDDGEGFVGRRSFVAGGGGSWATEHARCLRKWLCTQRTANPDTRLGAASRLRATRITCALAAPVSAKPLSTSHTYRRCDNGTNDSTKQRLGCPRLINE